MRIDYSFSMGYSLLHCLWNKQSLNFKKCSWPMHAIHTLGKYMLFSCYGMTAHSNASPVAFAILFANKNTSTRRQLWKYCLALHSCIDSGNITIITDQDKGQKNAISKYLWLVGHFHCSFHRRQNIIKMCGGGGGKVPNSALWIICWYAAAL